MEIKAGTTLGRYDLDERLAQGGMGDVWLATIHGSAGFEKRAAVKVLAGRYANNSTYVRLLEEEARVGCSLNHENLIEIYDFGNTNGVPYLAMEYVRGQSLTAVLKRHRRQAKGNLEPWFILRVLAACCKGLHYAHEHSGVLHCDLSPGNIMVSYTGLTKVLDFGAAHRQAKGKPKAIVGKFRFMAPERFEHRDTDARSDVYSLGVVLYLLFTGKLPYQAKSDAALLKLVSEGQAKAPSALVAIDPEIEKVILKAIAHDPIDRYQSVDGLFSAITRCIARFSSSQDDIAMFMGSLFSEAEEVPLYIRRRLATVGDDHVSETDDTKETRAVPEADDEPSLEISVTDLEFVSIEEVSQLAAPAMAAAAAAGTTKVAKTTKRAKTTKGAQGKKAAKITKNAKAEKAAPFASPKSPSKRSKPLTARRKPVTTSPKPIAARPKPVSPPPEPEAATPQPLTSVFSMPPPPPQEASGVFGAGTARESEPSSPKVVSSIFGPSRGSAEVDTPGDLSVFEKKTDPSAHGPGQLFGKKGELEENTPTRWPWQSSKLEP